jgi:hypothetical protein
MKQKYIISIDSAGKHILIKEFAEIDKEIYSLLCKETYATDAVAAAVKKGENSLILLLRTKNLYPPITTAEKIAESVEDLLKSKSNETIEVFIDDVDSLSRKDSLIEMIEDIDEESPELDEMLDDQVDDYEENVGIKNINASIKVDDDEIIDDNGEV